MGHSQEKLMQKCDRRMMIRRAGKACAATVLLLLAVNALCPFPDSPSGAPTPGGKVDALASALRPGWVILAGGERYWSAVEEAALVQACGRPVAKVTAKYPGSAWMYLFLKNVAPEHCVVVLPFSGPQLTYAELFADSGRKELGYLMNTREPVVERLTYLARMPAREYWLRRLCPLYAWREPLGKKLDAVWEQEDEAVFSPERADPKLQQAMRLRRNIAMSQYENRIWDFQQQIPDSYLPELIQISRQKAIRLVWVEVPGMQAESQEMTAKYRADLLQYLNGTVWTIEDSGQLLPLLMRQLPAVLPVQP